MITVPSVGRLFRAVGGFGAGIDSEGNADEIRRWESDKTSSRILDHVKIPSGLHFVQDLSER